ncbi:cold shock domain-containing protein [Paucibacter sp. AS339]|uniref:cold shock domain-containing protein n=1 Tax=Paucibacter hankyongi TaxID=3133434 RepID=UPI0030AE5662
MRFEGTLTQWQVDRGFGAITPLHGGQALFVHISAFPANSAQPMQNELLSFEVVSGSNGQKQAARVQRPKSTPSFAEASPARAQQRRAPLKPKRPAMAYLALALVLGVGVVAWLDYAKAEGSHVAKLVGSKPQAGATVLR